MKKIFPFLVITVAGILFASIGCRKESALNRNSNAHSRFNPQSIARMTTQTLRSNDAPLSELAVGTDDSESVLINVRAYAASALAEVLKDSTVSDWVTKACQGTTENFIRLDSLMQEFPFVVDMFKAHADPLGVMTWTDLGDMEDKLDYKGYQYRLGIMLVNPATSDASTRAVVTPGIEALNHWDDDIRDHAFAWAVKDGDWPAEEVTVGEEQALGLDAPFLSVVMQVKNIDNSTPTGEFPEPSSVPPFTTDLIEDVARVTGLKVNNWYEAGVDDNDKRNEVHITSKHLYTPNWGSCPANTYSHMQTGCVSGSFLNDKKIAELPKSVVDNGTHFSCDHFFAYLAPSWNSSLQSVPMLTQNRHTYFNMYERDWWAFNQPLGYAYWWCGGLALEGRMNNASDYYLYAPQQSNFYWRRVDLVNMWINWLSSTNNGAGAANPWGNGYGARHHGDIHPNNYADIRIFINCN